jgi:hypothetical protein
MDFEKMKREEEAAVEAMYGKKEVPSEDESHPEEFLIDDDDFEDVESAPEATTQDDEETTVQSEHKESTPRTSWKKRYASYKATTDNTIFELRKEVAGWKSRMASREDTIDELTKEVRRLTQEAVSKVDPFDGVFSPEEVDLIGPEAVDIIKKAIDSRVGKTTEDPAIKALEAKLERLEKEKRDAMKREAESIQTESMEQIKARLSKLVPDWSTIDLEPGFEKYITGTDEASGVQRLKFFQTAINDRNVSALAGFYNHYKSLKPKSKQEVLASRVTPSGNGGSESSPLGRDNPKKVYSIKEYTDFMDSVARGDYRGSAARRKEAQLIERQFDTAMIEGRIR